MSLRVARIVEETASEGPGLRFAVWVQGCSLRCPGCCNPHLFAPDGGPVIPVDALVARLQAAASRVEGVTLLGGEPFEQAAPLARFAQAARRRGLSVAIFTGYRLEELRAPGAPPGSPDLLAATDLLVDGRFEAALPERERRWAGSTNQRFHYLTDRYGPAIERPGPGEPLQTVEVRLLADGQVLVNGWPERWG